MDAMPSSLGHHPDSVPFVVATSDLYRPMGTHGIPEPSAYTVRLRSMLLPGENADELFVAHDPVSGDAAFTYRCVPHLNDEGNVVLMPLAEVPPAEGMGAGAGPTAAAASA